MAIQEITAPKRQLEDIYTQVSHLAASLHKVAEELETSVNRIVGSAQNAEPKPEVKPQRSGTIGEIRDALDACNAAKERVCSVAGTLHTI